MLEQVHSFPDQDNLVLNVNVPDLPWNEIKGFKVTRLGQRHSSKAVVRDTDPRGREIFWIGAVADADDASEGTDFHALEQGYISITPLHTDLTRYQALDNTTRWLTEMSGADIGKA